MKGDFTRNTFRREAHLSGVRMQQGRVQLDADWNEQWEIHAYRDRTTHTDVIGQSGGPIGKDEHGNPLAGFEVVPVKTKYGNIIKLEVTKGRYYVDGILCENEEDAVFAGSGSLPPLPLPDYPGIYLVYLDVWEHHLTALEEPFIREVALGGPDTATRTKVVWQLGFQPFGDMDDPVGEFPTGKLAACAKPTAPPDSACETPASAGYQSLENQLYRVEVHEGGLEGSATFKWNKENASIVAPWKKAGGNELTVGGTGRDNATTFEPNQWVELTDEEHELRGKPGVMVQLAKVQDNVLTVLPETAQTPSDFTPAEEGATFEELLETKYVSTPKIRAWSKQGLSVIQASSGEWLELEHGVMVNFTRFGDHYQKATYRAGDYWMIPARVALKDVLWPDDSDGPRYDLPHGVKHHYCKLATIAFDGKTWHDPVDRRKLFPPLTDLPDEHGCCCEVTVGDDVMSTGDFSDIASAVAALVHTGGKICILPGHYELDFTLNIFSPSKRPLIISGCKERTRILAAEGRSAFSVERRNVTLESLSIGASCPGPAVALSRRSSGTRIVTCTIVNRRKGTDGTTGRPDQDVPHTDGSSGRPDQEVPNTTGSTGRQPASAEEGDYPPPWTPEEEGHSEHADHQARADAEKEKEEPPKYDPATGEMLPPGKSEHENPHDEIAVGAAIGGNKCQELEILACDLAGFPSVALLTREVIIRENRIQYGGVWIAAGSSSVTIDKNSISRGRGPGIILGGSPEQALPGKVPSRGVTEVRITDNAITHMSGSGITTVNSTEDVARLGEFSDIIVRGNRIEGCVRGGVDPQFDPSASGGLVLRNTAEVRIDDNHIAHNGDSGGITACGIFMHTALNAEIKGNTILNNGSDETKLTRFLHFRDINPGYYANPFLTDDIDLTVYGDDGKPLDSTRIMELDTGRLFHCRYETRMGFETPVKKAVLLMYGSAKPTVQGRTAAGSLVAGEILVNRDSMWLVEVEGDRLVELRILSQQRESLGLIGAYYVPYDKGYQAGIVLRYVFPAARQVGGIKPGGFRDGFPAALVHDNQVVSMRGHALLAIGLGTMSFIRNHFTCLGEKDQPSNLDTIVKVLVASLKEEKTESAAGSAGFTALIPSGDFSAVADLAACVSIVNLGGQVARFGTGLKAGSATQYKRVDMSAKASFNATVGNNPMAVGTSIGQIPSITIPDCHTVFHDNRTTFKNQRNVPDDSNRKDSEEESAFLFEVCMASAGLISAGDLSIQNSHFGTTEVAKPINVISAALTTRTNACRFEEREGNVPISALMLAIYAIVTGNQASHPIAALGAQVIDTPNQVLV